MNPDREDSVAGGSMKRFFERKFKFEGDKAWLNSFLAVVVSMFIGGVFLLGFYHSTVTRLYTKTNDRLGKSVLDTVSFVGEYVLERADESNFVTLAENAEAWSYKGTTAPAGYQATMQELVDRIMDKDPEKIFDLEVGIGDYLIADAGQDTLAERFGAPSQHIKGRASLSDHTVDMERSTDVKNLQMMYKAFAYRYMKYDATYLTWNASYRFVFWPTFLSLFGIFVAFGLLGFLFSRIIKKDTLLHVVQVLLVAVYLILSLIVSAKFASGNYVENSTYVMKYYNDNASIAYNVIKEYWGDELTDEDFTALADEYSTDVYGDQVDGFFYNDMEMRIEEDYDVKRENIRIQNVTILFGWILGLILSILAVIALVRKNNVERILNNLYNFSTAYLYIFPGILSMLVLVFVPIIFTVILSFTSLPKYFTEINIARNFIGMENFSELLYMPEKLNTRIDGNEITIKYRFEDVRGKKTLEFASSEAGKYIVINYESPEESGVEKGSFTYEKKSTEPVDLVGDSGTSDSFWAVYFQLDENGEIIKDTLTINEGTLQKLFNNPRSFYYTLAFTIGYTLLSVILQVVLGVVIAVILYDKDVKFTSGYQVIFMLPWIIPTFISGIIWNYIFGNYGVIDQLMNVFSQAQYYAQLEAGLSVVEPAVFTSGWMVNPVVGFIAVSFVSAWYAFPFIMLVTLSALQTIPKSVFEAAMIDGANWFQTLFKIVLPMIRPTVLPSVLLTSIWTFNNFELVYLFTGGDDRYDILITRIYDFLNVPPEIAQQYGWTYGYAAAYSTLIFIVLLFYIYIFARASKITEKTF